MQSPWMTSAVAEARIADMRREAERYRRADHERAPNPHARPRFDRLGPILAPMRRLRVRFG
jgi:hypothetical protein